MSSQHARLLITAGYWEGPGQREMWHRGPIPTRRHNTASSLLRSACHYLRADALYMQIQNHISEIAVKSRDQMKGTAATVRFNHACLSPPIPLHSSVCSSINLIVVPPCLMVTSSRLPPPPPQPPKPSCCIYDELRGGESKWPPAPWWKPMQLECNRGSSIIQQPQKKTERAAFSSEPQRTCVRAELPRPPRRPSSLTSLKCEEEETRHKNRGAQLWLGVKRIENQVGEMWALISSLGTSREHLSSCATRSTLSAFRLTACYSLSIAVISPCAAIFWVSVIFFFFIWAALHGEESYISAPTDSVTDVQACIAFACINHGDLTEKMHSADTIDPSKCMNEKNNQTQRSRGSMWSCKAHMSVFPTPLHTEIKEPAPEKHVLG